MSKARIITAIVVVLAIASGVSAFAISSARVAEVRVAEVRREDLAVVVSASGEVEADSRVDVYPPTAGTLESVLATEGASVVAGQVIAVMNVDPIEAQVAQAEAAYAGAVAQRNSIARTVPGPADHRAAQAAVDAARSAYELANAQYTAAVSGAGGPSPADLATAKLAAEATQMAAESAVSAYDAFYANVYLPAPEPRAPEIETALAALRLARDLATANMLTARQNLSALQAASSGGLTAAGAKVGRDQAYAAYLGAVAQTEALSRAAGVTGAMASADAALEAAAAAKALAEEILEKATIVAPVDGILLFNSATASLGAGLSGFGAAASPAASELGPGSSVSPASAPFTIVSFETLRFTALVDETDVVSVRPGMRAAIQLDGLPDEEFTAEVSVVGIEAVTTPTGGTAFPVEIEFLSRGLPVLLGMNGSVEIAIETVGNVVTIPVEALLEEEGVDHVFVVDDGRARRAQIEVGRFTDTRIEIRSGLEEGDRVIVSGVGELTDGDRVQAE